MNYSALIWRNHLSDVIVNELGFKYSISDPDIWMKSSIPSSGSKLYAYILVHVDDIFIIDKDLSKHMYTLHDNYTVKPSSIDEPKLYLGANVNKVFYLNGTYAWAMGSTSYAKVAIKNVRKVLVDQSLRFNKKLSDPLYMPMNPFSTQLYRSESDVSNESNDFLTTYF